MKLVTAHYYQKLFIRSLFNDDTYHTLKLYKIILKYLIGKDEDQIYSFIHKILPPDSVIIDVGANMGQYACRLSKIFPHGKIFSIEPFETNYVALKRIKKLLHLKNVETMNLAISDLSGEFELAVPIINNKLVIGTQAHLNRFNEKEKFENAKYKIFKVKTSTLDSFISVNNISKIDFIKVDTEGFDSLVLKSGKVFIQKFTPLIRLEENYDSGKFDWLLDFGYTPFFLSEQNKILLTKNSEKVVGDNFLVFKDKLKNYSDFIQ